MALWRLPRPDLHRLVDTDFQDTPLTLWPARSRSRLATLSIESSDSFVASTAVSIATGWNEPVPGRELHPLKSSAFHGALFRQLRQITSIRCSARLIHLIQINDTSVAKTTKMTIAQYVRLRRAASRNVLAGGLNLNT